MSKKLKIQFTDRKFPFVAFMDMSGQICSLQKSSLAFTPAIWLGVSNTGPEMSYPHINIFENKDVSVRMHLDQNQVKAMLPFLKRFAATGEIH